MANWWSQSSPSPLLRTLYGVGLFLAQTDRPTTTALSGGSSWKGASAYPSTWITEGGEATSVWIPPGGIEMTAELEDRLGEFAVEHLGPGADTFFELLARFEAAHPRDVDHYYLSLLGTHPDFRGDGTGMWLLTHDLEI